MTVAKSRIYQLRKKTKVFCYKQIHEHRSLCTSRRRGISSDSTLSPIPETRALASSSRSEPPQAETRESKGHYLNANAGKWLDAKK